MNTTMAKARPSSNARLNKLMRVDSEDRPADGVTIPPPASGKLVILSVADAYKMIKAHAEAGLTEQRAKMARVGR